MSERQTIFPLSLTVAKNLGLELCLPPQEIKVSGPIITSPRAGLTQWGGALFIEPGEIFDGSHVEVTAVKRKPSGKITVLNDHALFFHQVDRSGLQMSIATANDGVRIHVVPSSENTIIGTPYRKILTFINDGDNGAIQVRHQLKGLDLNTRNFPLDSYQKQYLIFANGEIVQE